MEHVSRYQDFAEIFTQKIQKLSSHRYEYKQQNQFYEDLKKTLPKNWCIAAGDFSENFSFFESHEIQSAYYGRKQCTIFPFIVNYNQNDEIKHFSATFISDSLKHGCTEVYSFISILNEHVKDIFPERTYQVFMSDGAAQHFKQKGNFANLACHHLDYGLEAEWNFQASSHGKGGLYPKSIEKALRKDTGRFF